MVCKRITRILLSLFLSLSAALLVMVSDCRAERTGDGVANTGNGTAEIIEEQLKAAGAGKISEEIYRYTDEETMELFRGFDADRLMSDLLAGRPGIGLGDAGSRLLGFFFRELYQNIGILVKITVLAVICAILKNLQAGFMSEGAAQIAFYACYIVLVSMLLVSFGTVMKMGITAIDRMVGFMYASVPVLMALLVSGGNITAGGILHPVMLLIVEVSATVIRNAFVPLVFISAILAIVNNISEKIQLTRMVSLIRQIVSWSLGIIPQLIIAVSVQGTLGYHRRRDPEGGQVRHKHFHTDSRENTFGCCRHGHRLCGGDKERRRRRCDGRHTAHMCSPSYQDNSACRTVQSCGRIARTDIGEPHHRLHK